MKKKWRGAFTIFNTPYFDGTYPDLMIFNQDKLVIAIELKFYFQKGIDQEAIKRCEWDIKKLINYYNSIENLLIFFIVVTDHETDQQIKLKKIIKEKQINEEVPNIIFIDIKMSEIWKIKSKYLLKFIS